MVVYTLEQRWEVDLRSTYRRCRFWQKKNHLFSRVTSKIVAFGAQKSSTHIFKSRRTQNEALFDADFGPET